MEWMIHLRNKVWLTNKAKSKCSMHYQFRMPGVNHASGFPKITFQLPPVKIKISIARVMDPWILNGRVPMSCGDHAIWMNGNILKPRILKRSLPARLSVLIFRCRIVSGEASSRLRLARLQCLEGAFTPSEWVHCPACGEMALHCLPFYTLSEPGLGLISTLLAFLFLRLLSLVKHDICATYLCVKVAPEYKVSLSCHLG
jgi:hypothetical protein